jgi:hypothetical protein
MLFFNYTTNLFEIGSSSRLPCWSWRSTTTDRSTSGFRQTSVKSPCRVTHPLGCLPTTDSTSRQHTHSEAVGMAMHWPQTHHALLPRRQGSVQVVIGVSCGTDDCIEDFLRFGANKNSPLPAILIQEYLLRFLNWRHRSINRDKIRRLNPVPARYGCCGWISWISKYTKI